MTTKNNTYMAAGLMKVVGLDEQGFPVKIPVKNMLESGLYELTICNPSTKLWHREAYEVTRRGSEPVLLDISEPNVLWKKTSLFKIFRSRLLSENVEVVIEGHQFTPKTSKNASAAYKNFRNDPMSVLQEDDLVLYELNGRFVVYPSGYPNIPKSAKAVSQTKKLKS